MKQFRAGQELYHLTRRHVCSYSLPVSEKNHIRCRGLHCQQRTQPVILSLASHWKLLMYAHRKWEVNIAGTPIRSSRIIRILSPGGASADTNNVKGTSSRAHLFSCSWRAPVFQSAPLSMCRPCLPSVQSGQPNESPKRRNWCAKRSRIEYFQNILRFAHS